MKVVDFKKMFIERDELDKRLKKADDFKKEYKKLVEATTEEEYIKIIQDNFYWFNENIFNQFDFCSDFYEGFARVKKDGKYGFLKPDGTMLTGFDYDYCSDFYKGFARVRNNYKYGFLKSDGTMLTDIIYDFCYDFYKGFASVQLDTIWRKIDTQGNFTVE